MSLDIQSFDPNEDPAVKALEESTKDGQTEITAVISPEVAKQQAAFAELREEIQNGAVTFASTILKLAVPAAQAEEKTKEEDNAWDNLNPDNPELAKWIDDYMKSSPAEQKSIMANLKKTRDINHAIEKVAESLPEIDPLPDNTDHQTMVKKLAEIEARAKVLQREGKKLTNSKDRAYFLAEMKKRFASYPNIQLELRDSRGNSVLYPYVVKILRIEIKLINKFRSFLKNASEEAKVTAVRNSAAAREAEAAVKAKKSRKKAKDYYRSLYAQGYTREDIIESQAKVDLRDGKNELERNENMAVLIEMLDEIAEEDRKK